MIKKLARWILRKELLTAYNDGVMRGYGCGMIAGKAESRNLGYILSRMTMPKGLAQAQDILRKKQ